MKIISWDVGITHLAYCIMEYDKNNSEIPYNIHKWNIINLLTDKTINQTQKMICWGINKTKKKDKDKKYICQRKPLYYCILDDKTYGFCGIHSKTTYNDIVAEYVDKNKSFQQVIKEIKQKCTYHSERKNTNCCKNAHWELNGSYYCSVHKKSIENNINNGMKLQKIKKQKTNKVSINLLAENLFKILDNIPELLQVKEVLVENQPSFKNPRMKTISSLLYSWFIIRGLLDNKTTNSTIEKVSFISPSNKLKTGLYDDDNDIVESEHENKDIDEFLDNINFEDPEKQERIRYKQTKEQGIIYCYEIIKHDKKHLDFLNNQPKKDDLCDAFLQGVWYLTKILKINNNIHV